MRTEWSDKRKSGVALREDRGGPLEEYWAKSRSKGGQEGPQTVQKNAIPREKKPRRGGRGEKSESLTKGGQSGGDEDAQGGWKVPKPRKSPHQYDRG